MRKSVYVFLGVVAAASVCFASQPNGAWNISADAPDGHTYKAVLSVEEAGGQWAASVKVAELGVLKGTEVAFRNGELSFKIPNQRVDYVVIKLKADESTIKGTMETPDGDLGMVTGTRIAASSPGIAGVWKVASEGSEGSMALTLELKVSGKQLTGQMTAETGDSVPVTGQADGDQIRLQVETEDGTYSVSGTVSGNRMQGTYKSSNGTSGKFSATRP
jgi:hypothetical protein